MIKVLIVDDHQLVRTGIKRMLEEVATFKIIGEAETGEQAVKMARELAPDVILMDLNMPGIGGLEATLKLQRFNPDARVLVITTRDDLFFPERLMQAGAMGYLTKDASLDEMIRAIRLVNVGQRYIASELATQLAVKSVTRDSHSPFESLSDRELQVAIMVVKGIKVAIIADQLHLSPKTVNSYRYRIFTKLGIKSDVDLTHFAMQYKLLESTEMANEPVEAETA